MYKRQLLDESLATAEKLLNDIQVLACFGTIADSMPLIGDNRRIVMDGIALVNSGRAMFCLLYTSIWNSPKYGVYSLENI